MCRALKGFYRGPRRLAPRVVVLNYGVGNLFSIKNALEKAGVNVEVLSDIHSSENIDAIVLPGVGNFRMGSKKLLRIKDQITDLVENNVPILGICLGMQLFFKKSEESPGNPGLNLLDGVVVKFPKNVKIPHMGWNTIEIVRSSDFLEGVSEKDYFYFVHSYYAIPKDPSIIVAKTEYGVNFPSVVAKNNIFGVQFHPEKSGESGKKIIKNFLRIIKR